MENATNALLIAGAVLIGVLILTTAVYLFTMFGDSGATLSEQLTQRQTDEFNAQFYQYENQGTVRIHDIITVANLAKQNNIDYEYTTINEGPFYITVTISNLSGSEGHNLETMDSAQANELLAKYSLKEEADGSKTPIYFKCTGVEINADTRRVSSITFEKID